MNTPTKLKTIDDLCNKTAGTFSKFIAQKRAFQGALETERKERIRVCRQTVKELSWAA